MATNDPLPAVTRSGPSQTTAHRDTLIEPTPRIGGHQRISWGAIFAGVVIALVCQLAFALLGLAIGASAFNPYDTPGGGFGVGAAIWTLLSVLVSLFVGGYVAGRLAGVPRPHDAILHGLVTFGLTSLIGFYLLTTGIGTIIGGAGSLVSSVVSSAGQAAASTAPGMVDAAKSKLQESGVDTSNIQAQVNQLLQETGKPELQPGNLQARAQNAGGQAQNAAQNPTDVKGLVDRLFGQNQDVAKAADRDALINVIMSRTGKSRSEAEQIVNNYQQTFEQAQAKAQQAAEDAKQKALAAADAARKGAAKGGLAAFFALLLGALAAAFGGRTGTPKIIVDTTVTEPSLTRG
jgi:hypothetical protein